MTKENEAILRAAVKKWGVKAQCTMVIEEMSELIKEICKMKRGQFDRKNMLEEMADVQIMLWQMSILFGDPGKWIDEKISRLEERLKE